MQFKTFTKYLSGLLVLGSLCQVQAQHNNELFNDGALITVQPGAEIHVWGDAHMQGASATLNNNGLIKVQGNLYSDDQFQQRGTGTVLMENSNVNTNERQFISGSYAVRGGTAQIGVNDGSFYNLELNNSQQSVYLVRTGTENVADVRNTINFDPSGLGATQATNLVTDDIGLTGPITYPANGSNYRAVFGMMNDAPGLGKYINDTWHQSGGDNLSVQDNGYIIGKHRRAIRASGGTYGYIMGLAPGAATANNGTAQGFQYIHLNFGANNYEVITGHFEQGSPNSSQGPGAECNGINMNQFWGALHGEWMFDDINNVTNGGTYEVRVWPQDPITPWSGATWTISKDDVFQYATPPLQNDCGSSPTGLDRNGFEDFSAFGVVSGTIILDAEIVDLHAVPINNRYIDILWTTNKEVDVDHFVIERSTDDANFVPIATQTALGTSFSAYHYNLSDQAVLPNINYYYRIQIVNTDGTTEYTPSVVAVLQKEGHTQTVNVFPNPLHQGAATVEVVSNTDRDAFITVYDAIGQRLINRTINIQKGLNTFQLEVDQWASGLYYIHIHSEEASTVKELIKSE